MNKPNWAYWTNLADVELSQAVELSCGIAPGLLDDLAAERYIRADLKPLKDTIETRLSVARSHIAAGTLPVEHRTSATNTFPYHGTEQRFIKLADFRAWGESLPDPFTFPDEFPGKAKLASLSAEPNQTFGRSAMTTTLGYSDFIRLFRVDDPEDFAPGLVVRSMGVFVVPPPDDVHLTPEERATLTEHPTGNLSKSALSFPFNIDDLEAFVDCYGLRGAIDGFTLLKVMRQNAFTQAQLDAIERGYYHWPIVANLYRLKTKWMRQHDTTANDSKKVVWRAVLDELDALLPDPDREGTPPAQTSSSSDTEKPLRTDTRKNWLRIIRALYEKANLSKREAVGTIEQMIDSLGFAGPKDDAIRKVLDEARALEPDHAPK